MHLYWGDIWKTDLCRESLILFENPLLRHFYLVIDFVICITQICKTNWFNFQVWKLSGTLSLFLDLADILITETNISNNISAFTIRELYFIKPIRCNYIRGVIEGKKTAKLIYVAEGYEEFHTLVYQHTGL